MLWLAIRADIPNGNFFDSKKECLKHTTSTTWVCSLRLSVKQVEFTYWYVATLKMLEQKAIVHDIYTSTQLEFSSLLFG